MTRGEEVCGLFTTWLVKMDKKAVDLNITSVDVVQMMEVILKRLRPIARTLLSMEREEGWRVRLLALRKSSKAANGLSVFVYHQDIFDLIIDRYEEEYLRRFSEPRWGNKNNAPNIEEMRRFWNYLKARTQAQQEWFIHQEESEEQGNLPPLKWREVLSLIWNKVFTVKTGTLTSIVFALCFEVTRRWPFIAPWLTVVSVLTLMLCATSLRFRKTIVFTLSDIGAVALLFSLLWTVGLLSSDGIIRSPDGSTLSLNKTEQKIDIKPILWGNSDRVNFNITEVPEGTKEFLYRVKPDTEYHSTGFIPQSSYPNMIIENLQKEGTINLDVKYIDHSGHEHGPWSFSFDIDTERFKLKKQVILNIKEPWIEIYRLTYADATAATFVMLYPTLILPRNDDTISAVIYGLNTNKPETILTHEDILNLEQSPQIAEHEDDDIKYASSYLIFKDGTSSDIRYSKLSHK